MIQLKDVTLCAADSAQPRLALRAMQKSMEGCEFGDAILFCSMPYPASVARCISIESLNSREEYSRFVLKELAAFISTPFVLLVQWDGYVLEPGRWSDSFKEYDLIGAKWPWHRDGKAVGNGGFSLRSLKLLKAMAQARFPFIEGIAEDEQICRVYRDALVEEFGIRFAPETVADRFSYERAMPAAPTFGFHGLFNMWRHVDDAEIIEIAGELHPYVLRSREYHELLLHYYALRKFRPLGFLYRRLRAHADRDEIASQLMTITNKAELTQTVIGLCEDLAFHNAKPG